MQCLPSGGGEEGLEFAVFEQDTSVKGPCDLGDAAINKPGDNTSLMAYTDFEFRAYGATCRFFVDTDVSIANVMVYHEFETNRRQISLMVHQTGIQLVMLTALLMETLKGIRNITKTLNLWRMIGVVDFAIARL